MATFNKFNCFVEHLAEKVHNLGADTLTVALTDVSPAATLTTLADITLCTGHANLSSRVISLSGASPSQQVAGTYKLVVSDLTLTASPAVGPFRYAVIYNDTAVSPVDALIGFYDYGSSITLQTGETLTLDFDQTNGLLTLQ